MSHRTLALLLLPLLGACDAGDAIPPAGTLTISGALAEGPAPALRSLADPVLLGTGDPSRISIGLYGLHLAAAPDCSDPVVASPEGDIAWHDFAAAPTLFSATPPDGTYHCVALRMSDVMRFVPATSPGNCVAGTEYEGDIYRSDSDETPWHDLAHAPIVGTGSDDAPADDRVIIVATTDTAAAIAAGFSPHQIVRLTAPLVVPGSATFVVDARDGVQSWAWDGVPHCGLEKLAMGFE